MKKKRKSKATSDTTKVTVQMPLQLVYMLRRIAALSGLDVNTVCNVMLAVAIWSAQQRKSA